MISKITKKVFANKKDNAVPQKPSTILIDIALRRAG